MYEVTSNDFEAAAQNNALKVTDFATQHTLRFIESVTKRRSNLRFLEVGCGKGHLAKALVDRGHQVLPIDVSEEAVAFARSLGLPAKQTNIFDVNGSAFDGILFIQSLHHISPLDQSLAQAARLLDKGGFVLVDDFAFSKMDEETAVWFQGVQNVFAGAGIDGFHRINIDKAFAHLMSHYAEHGIHTGDELIRASKNVFPNVEISEGGPYLFRHFVPKMESRPESSDVIKAIFDWERFQIEKGFIKGLGLRVIGFK
ncbi:MAG: class I SAM-dependent methyltransferase [Verrucomicrobia bacterium]|nr:class I SAM-dependent methyltransferase [Verrucomicrobiota bacterium]MBV8482668.1 class I SAM-dependent methyltransferase [Verrucomicrobiota bacterium]